MAESKKPNQNKLDADDVRNVVAQGGAQRARREELFGSASVSPPVPSLTEPRASGGGNRTFVLGDSLLPGEAASGTQGGRLRQQMAEIKTPAGLAGSTETGDVGVFSGAGEQFIGIVAQADATRDRLEDMIRDPGSPIKAHRSTTKLVDRGMRGAPRTTSSVRNEAIVTRLRLTEFNSGNAMLSALNPVGGQGPVKVNKQLVAEGNEELRQKEIKNRARRKDKGAKKNPALAKRQKKQMEEAAKKRGPGPY